MNKTKIFKLISILLNYPDRYLKEHLNTILIFIKDDKTLSEDSRERLSSFIIYLETNNLMFLQEKYVSLFDRQKSFSLYLFEHIHGDSKERGSAMIDLQNLYKSYGFGINETKELPDYLPLFLEFISLIPEKEAYNLLGEIINLISVIKKRLEISKSQYFLVFSVLESLSAFKPDYNIVNKAIDKGILLENILNADKELEEKQIL